MPGGRPRLRALASARIGAPRRPEFAAWRYGDQFGRRRTRNLVIAGAGIAAGGALIAGPALIVSTVGIVGFHALNIGRLALFGSPHTVVARIRGNRGVAAVRRTDLKAARIRPSTLTEGWILHLEHEEGFVHVTGEDARAALGVLLPHVNRFGGARADVVTAVERLERAGGPESFLRQALPSRARHGDGRAGVALSNLETSDRLALEMSLHEESERRAMAGELAALEARWKEAEEIAAIADDLFLPGPVGEALAGLKRRLGGA